MLVVTLKNPSGKGFIKMPGLPAGMSGSITDGIGDGATTVVFTCKADDTGAVIHRSVEGIEIETGMFRIMDKNGMQELAQIELGESYEMQIEKPHGYITLAFEHVYGALKVVH